MFNLLSFLAGYLILMQYKPLPNSLLNGRKITEEQLLFSLTRYYFESIALGRLKTKAVGIRFNDFPSASTAWGPFEAFVNSGALGFGSFGCSLCW